MRRPRPTSPPSVFQSRRAVQRIREAERPGPVRRLPERGGDPEVFAPVYAALLDDLNTPAAFGALFTIVNRGNAGIDRAAFDAVINVIGLNLDITAAAKAEAPENVRALAEKRWAAKQAKDFAAADKLRAEIAATGWAMLDRKEGFELKKAEG